MSSDSHFGVRLREAREGANLTQHELARRIGCHDQEISRYERGGVKPRTERIEQLAAALDVLPGWLLFGGPVPPTETAESNEAA